MSSDAELQLAYKIGNVPFGMFPYPHFYLQDVFPADFYRQLQQNLPDPQAMIPLEQARGAKGYKERFVLGLTDEHLATLPDAKRAFWKELNRWMIEEGNFSNLIFNKFRPFIEQRFAGQTGLNFYSETLLVQDVTNYKLGPHTDLPRKVVTMLFYLPPDDSQRHLGTSMYLPADGQFTCPGGPHHEREKFLRLHTNPFLPNSLFAFFKTNNSFHGVEPVADPDTRRWLLLFDIYVKETAPAQSAAVPIVTPKLKFTF